MLTSQYLFRKKSCLRVYVKLLKLIRCFLSLFKKTYYFQIKQFRKPKDTHPSINLLCQKVDQQTVSVWLIIIISKICVSFASYLWNIYETCGIFWIARKISIAFYRPKLWKWKHCSLRKKWTNSFQEAFIMISWYHRLKKPKLNLIYKL